MKALALAALLAAGCAHGHKSQGRASDGPELVSEPLRAALARPAEAMTAARTRLTLQSGVVVSTCDAYLRARRAGAEVSESTDARLASSEYLVCDALDAVRCADHGAGGGHAAFGDELAARLDLREIPSSLGPRLDERVHTLAALGEPLRKSATEVGVLSADWTFALRLAAVADVDGDGKSDWVVWMTDEARTSTYRNYATLVILAPDNPGPLRIVRWPSKGEARKCPG